jgi:LacI family transcriptional regulator
MSDPDSSHLIGFFCDMPMVGSGYYAMVQLGLLTACRKAGCELLVKAFDLQSSDIPEQVHALVSQLPLRGVVLPEPICEFPEMLAVLRAAKMRVVRIGPKSEAADTFDICIDNFQAAYDMTTYLIGLGHKRIAFVRGPEHHADAIARLAGFNRAMAEAGLAVGEELCVPGTFEYSSGIAAGEKLLSLERPPTAIFACNDEMALAVLGTVHRLGRRIPEDFSLVGFDDSPLARKVWPELTTCRQKMELTGYMAADFLIDPPAAPEARKRPLQHELVIRQSTARAAERL